MHKVIHDLLEARDAAYAEFYNETEELFYQRYVKDQPSWGNLWPTRDDFHLADATLGASISTYIEAAALQRKTPAWLAAQLFVNGIALDPTHPLRVIKETAHA